jgi:predicted permease
MTLRSSLEGLWQDIRHGVRVFAKNPGFTAIAIISIAFGTGANVAIFSVADALLLRPLPVPRSSEVVTVGMRDTLGFRQRTHASYLDYLDIRDRATSFSGLAAFEFTPVAVRAQPGAAARMRLATVASANLFTVMEVEPVLGRGFLPEEERVSDQNAVAVLSYGVWRDQFNADPAVIGRRIAVAGIQCAIVGVAPESFTGLHPFVRDSVYLPLALWPKVATFGDGDPLTQRDKRVLTLKGRLRPGVSMRSALAELNAIGRGLSLAHPDTNAGQLPIAQSEWALKMEQRPIDLGLVAILTTLSIAVLCVACANVASLFASRAPVRAREMALRLSIGASRARLIRQLLTEALAVAIVGSAAGVVIGYLGIAVMQPIDFPAEIIARPPIVLDTRALYFSLALAAATAVLVGLGPALQTTRVDLAGSLKSTDSAGRPGARITGRRVLVGLQIALCLAMVTVAAFCFQVFSEELRRGPGWRTTQMAKVTINPGQILYSDEQSAQLAERVVNAARALPGARSAATTSAMPMFSFEGLSLLPEDYQLAPGETGVFTFTNSVTAGYFDTMGIPLVDGRGFRSSDTAATAPVAIVNETFVRRYWPNDRALGRRFKIADKGDAWIEIVGVAAASTYHHPTEPAQPFVYFPFQQRSHGAMVLLVETAGESAAMIPAVRDMLARVAPDVPAWDYQTIEAFYDARFTAFGRILNRLIAGMGVMGVTLTMVGLFGLVSYAVSRRTREIGIRMAIGATPGNVVALILRQGLWPVVFGLLPGLGLSIAAARVLPSFVNSTSTTDPRLFPSAMATLFALSVAAAMIPARRAARVNPTAALRHE